MKWPFVTRRRYEQLSKRYDELLKQGSKYDVAREAALRSIEQEFLADKIELRTLRAFLFDANFRIAKPKAPMPFAAASRKRLGIDENP